MTSQDNTGQSMTSPDIPEELDIFVDVLSYGDMEAFKVFCRWMSQMSEITDESIFEAIRHTMSELS